MTDAPRPLSLQHQPEPWDLVAPTYAEDAWQWAEYAKEALRTLPVRSTDRVLDIATGPGTLAFSAAFRAARVDAVDFSPGMIAELVARAAASGVTNITASVMDAQALDFPDATFDSAFCMFAFFFFPDRAKAFRELQRVIRPGGRALIATWAPIDRRPVMKIAFDAMAEALPHLPRPAKGDLQDPDDCVREMSDAGFEDVVATPFNSTVRFDSAEKYLATILRSAAPLAVMKQKLDPAVWDAQMAKLLEVIRRSVPETGADLGAEAILTVGTRPAG